MRIGVPRAVRDVARELRRHGHESYVVGGAVRDLQMGRRPKDWDIATDATPSLVEGIFPKTIPTGKKFGTISVRSDAHWVQVTTYRSEGSYKDRRHPEKVSFEGDLKKDLSRRDFTVNAMAYDPFRKVLIDPFGGRKDLRVRTLRCVGDARERFNEDLLRPVRAARFLAELGLRPDAALARAARKAAPRTTTLSKERVRDELVKLLLSPRPEVGLAWMEQVGLLKALLPEVAQGRGVLQKGWHAYDVLRHTLETVRLSPPRLEVRLAALLHDIAKPKCRTYFEGRYHFHGHDRLGAKMAEKLLRRLCLPRVTIEHVSVLVRHHLFEAEGISGSDAAVRRLIRRVGEGRLPDLLDLRRADTRACGPRRRISPALDQIGRRARKILRSDHALSIRDLKIDGNEIMRLRGIAPGPEVGRTLRVLLERILEKPELNTPESLRRLVQHGGDLELRK